MSKLRPARAQDVTRILASIGFTLIRQSGSPAIWRHPDGRWTTAPMHQGKDVAKGTLRKIISDAGLDVDPFEKMR